MNEFFRRIRYLLNRRRFDQELADDMAFHREMAARAGSQNFGSLLRLREEARDPWGWTWIDRLVQDLRYAFRMMRRSPGFTLAAVLMLAFGIGINVAAFGFFNLVIFKPLPAREPHTLLRFHRLASQNYASAIETWTQITLDTRNMKKLTARKTAVAFQPSWPRSVASYPRGVPPPSAIQVASLPFAA